MTIKTIHVVFKTHLDIGFTDTAANVIRKYVDEYIPAAIELADKLERRGGPERFIWTTGSWLIRYALNHGSQEQRDNLDRAIREGKIVWHALPFSSHTELMTAGLFDHALSLAAELDAAYGRTSIAAKMTDVPGHTISMVPILRGAGVRYLHIGINPASTLPNVPANFRWRSSDGSEVVVTYDANYGTSDDTLTTAVAGQSDVLYMAFTNDNLGPPSHTEVTELFESLGAHHPEAEVKASTLDAYAASLLEHADQLPVIDEEIGDTWIHGPAGDPLLVSQFRRLQGLRERWLQAGALDMTSEQGRAFSDNLLMISEHTWGKDVKTWLPDYSNYSKTRFQAARQADVVSENSLPEIYQFAAEWSERVPASARTYAGLESSWAEQRSYILKALGSLPENLHAVALAHLDWYPPDRKDPACALAVGVQYKIAGWQVEIGADGSLVALIDLNGIVHADADHPIGQYRYETYASADYQRWLREYGRDMDVNAAWALPDHSKLGLEVQSDLPEAAQFVPCVTDIHQLTDGDDQIVRVTARMQHEATETRGAPRDVEIVYRFTALASKISIALMLTHKDAYRLPEASWFRLSPLVPNANNWRLLKMGAPVNPARVVRGGNRNMHAVDHVEYISGSTRKRIVSVDAPLVSPGAPRLLQFDGTFADPDGGFYFNLHNNVWGTNFRMWYGEDMTYAFELELS